MGNLLFSSQGRIGPQAFSRGAVVLLIANIILWMGWKVGPGVSMIAALITLMSTYSWACLFIKRFHDGNKSGWLFLPILIGFYFVANNVSRAILNMTNPEAVALLIEFQEIYDPFNPDTEVLFEYFPKIAKAMALPFAVGYLIVGAAFAFGTNAVIKSDPLDNQYGPATA